MNVADLQREIYAINCEKGWHGEPLQEKTVSAVLAPETVHTSRVLAKLALIHSELVEAEEEAALSRFDVYYNPAKPTKPEGYVVELADAVIRSLDTCEALGLPCGPSTFLVRSSTLHAYVAAATEAARVGDYARFAAALGGLVHCCERIVEAKGYDLWEVVREKVDYNKTRPHRHGGKKA